MSLDEPAPATLPYRSELSLRNRLGRALWTFTWTLTCRLSPRPFHAWRRFWLRRFGARIDSTASIYPRVRIWAPWNLEMGPRSGLADDVDCYNVAPIVLEEGAIVSQYAYLCTGSHDISDPGHRLVTAPILLRRLSWVCAGVYVHMGVTLEEGAVAAVRSVVMKSVPAWTVVGGNPAKPIKMRVLRDAGSAPGS
jgi:putative colanic acid biosynthesis acetyltransferase WcaF